MSASPSLDSVRSSALLRSIVSPTPSVEFWSKGKNDCPPDTIIKHTELPYCDGITVAELMAANSS